MRTISAIALSVVLPLLGGSAAAGEVKPPFEITEDRERCENYDRLRQAFFGTTHLHTGLSFDASIRFVDFAAGNDPRGAYRFAKGERSITLPDPIGRQGTSRLRRPTIPLPLDWGGVTDHAEHFGEMGICKDFLGKDAPGRLALECRMINGFYYQFPFSVFNQLDRALASDAFTQLTMEGLGPVSRMTRTPLCENNPDTCDLAELAVWDEHRIAAEQEYDRSSECTFTTFVAYENTSTPLSTNWHRNVFFRNDRVVKRPVTAIDMAVRPNDSPTENGPDGVGKPVSWVGGIVPAEPDVFPVEPGTFVTHPLPERFWNRLEWACELGNDVTAGRDKRCQFISIPHNTNLGGGAGAVPPLYFDPFNAEDARRKARFEPLVEIYQDKGSSECRWDPRFKQGVETRDEFCNFELLDSNSLTSASGVGAVGPEDIDSVKGVLDTTRRFLESQSPDPDVGDFGLGGALPPSALNPRAYVRNIWKDGMALAEMPKYEGVNPFKMGVVAASDSHTGVMGFHPEDESWPGHLGIDDAWPVSRASTIQNSSGGHSVAWAEENSRDAIFAAMKRKETYGTSGTRILVRFFGGWDYDDDLCRSGYRNLVRTGYRDGVPMGGDLEPAPSPSASPSFIAAAAYDDFIGTNLEQIQIIKGWIDEDGEPRERVFHVAGERGDANNPEGGVFEDTCTTKPGGRKRLCAVWHDPRFNASERAFYYVRVLEKPVCRYSTHWCRERIGVDPFDLQQCQADLDEMAASTSFIQRLNAQRGAACCSDQTTFPIVQTAIQERAWTSPIWYEPGQ